MLTAAAVLALASQFPDWDPHWVVWQVFDAGTGNGESSGREDIVDPTGKYVGLMQIDWRLHGYTVAELKDPYTNLAAAHKLWQRDGTRPWPSAVKYPGRVERVESNYMVVEPDITRLSPNVNPGNMSLAKTVIIHCTRSGKSMNPTEFTGTLNYMAQSGTTSSHWVISRTGLAARVVLDTQQAWHAQEDNDNCWGIEVEQGAESDGFTEVQLAKLTEVCRAYVVNFGVPPVHAGTSTTPGFIGHQETAQGKRNGKSDPGRLFPWDSFIAGLQGGSEMPAENYSGEANERRVRELLIWALYLNKDDPAKIKAAFGPNGGVVLTPNTGSAVTLNIPIPDWAKPT